MLPQEMQAEILLQYGVYLELIRRTPQLNIELYALDHFYVELYFDKITEDPLFLRAFDSVKELEPYLPLIPIENILEVNH
ncbi:MAG: hypothetical protein J7502_16750 [Flavisolibacter sp.]|nr:hypothetical protein [Flavisolibacter sp.]